MEQDLVIEALEYGIKQNKFRLAEQIKRVFVYTDELRTMVETDNYDQSAQRYWVDGHVSEDVTKLGSLFQERRALQQSLAIVKKYQEGVQE